MQDSKKFGEKAQSMIEVFLGIILTTFVLEDLALVGSIALVAQGKISVFAAYTACLVGIAVGDLLLYFLGRWGKASEWLSQLPAWNRVIRRLNDPLVRTNFDYAIIISRAIPGTRMLTYIGAGLSSYPFFRFFF